MMLLYSSSSSPSVSLGVLRPQLTHTLLSLRIFPCSGLCHHPILCTTAIPVFNWLCAPAFHGVAQLGCCHCCHTSVPPGDSTGGPVTPGQL